MQPRVAVNVTQRKTINLLKTFFFAHQVSIIVCVFNMQRKTTFLVPVWPRDAERLDIPGSDMYNVLILNDSICKNVFITK